MYESGAHVSLRDVILLMTLSSHSSFVSRSFMLLWDTVRRDHEWTIPVPLLSAR